MERCPTCDATKTFKKGKTHHPVALGKGQAIEVEVPALICDACGETLVEGEEIQKAELRVAGLLVSHGIAKPWSFRFLRKAMGMRSQELADILGVRLETISRWENGSREFDRAAWLVLAHMVGERIKKRLTTAELSKALASPMELPAMLKSA